MILLTKYTGCCLTSDVASGHSMVITMLTTVLVSPTYNSSTSLSFGGTSVGRDFRYCFSSMKVVVA
jgi:hypothetical protein